MEKIASISKKKIEIQDMCVHFIILMRIEGERLIGRKTLKVNTITDWNKKHFQKSCKTFHNSITFVSFCSCIKRSVANTQK